MQRRLLPLVLVIAACSSSSGSNNADGSIQDGKAVADGGQNDGLLGDAAPTDGATTSSSPTVKLQTTFGEIVLQLDAAKAPKTVANFLNYVNTGHYDGAIFHRVIAGFMIQGGGFDANLTQKPTTTPIENEADNGLKNVRGTIAMARTSDPHSATAQFFINVADNPALDFSAKTTAGWGYAVFGKVVSGMDVVVKIENTPTGPKGPFNKDVPLTNVVITKASVQ